MQKIQNGLLSRYDKIPERRLSFYNGRNDLLRTMQVNLTQFNAA